ncbi:MAG: ribonuclease, Rne/Rng family, partial [Solirubrobacterales bacterium]|nr:ribonuclease, Rne/Rng family [Solirubrobacterales bacterium]
FEVVEEGKADEIAERAVPFSAGDEIKVQIVEPHMYNVDDAVAKIDGYIISVSGAGRLVGSKVLVRIDEAGRTSARATVIGEPEEPPAKAPARARSSARPAQAPTEEEDGEDAVDSKPRRRGRRGGRRRSAAKAAATTEAE